VRGENGESDPDVFISLRDAESANQDSADYKCTSWGMDICTVPYVKLVETIYIGVGCHRSCAYKLRALLVEEKYMSDNDQIELKFDKKHEDSEFARIITIASESEGEALCVQVMMENIYRKNEGF
jgi:hypothetical protein